MQETFPGKLFLLWCIFLVFGLGMALSFPGLADRLDYLVYMPFAAKPIPTPTCTPTTTPTPLPPDVRVDPTCSRVKDSTDELVCFKSYDTRPVDMTNWYVEDEAAHRYTFPPFVLSPGAIVRLHTGQGVDTATDLYWGRNTFVWNNDHDTVFLYDASDRLVSYWRY